MTTETQTALALPTGTDLVSMFQKPNAIDDMIARIENEARAEAPDLSTVKGRKAIASLAYKIAQSKTALDNAGKELNADLRARINATDAERRKARERLDALKAEIRTPLDEWEAKEEARVAGLRQAMDNLEGYRVTAGDGATEINAMIHVLDGVEIDETWAEFREDAERKRSSILEYNRAALAAAREREAQAAEIERLRAEAARREAEDRERRAKAEAEARARAEKEAAEKAEAERAEREAREKEAREKAEAERIERAREAERQEAARREKEAEERHAAALRQAEEKAARAAQAERDRIAEEKRREDEARAKREANARHREKVLREITKAITPIARGDLAKAMLDGKIPHVRVSL